MNFKRCDMKKLLVVDGNSIINRAYYAIRPLTTSTGLYTNAIFGMINILMKHIEAKHPDYCAIAFDLHAPTFRHKMYDAYKAGRHATPDELLMQFDPAKEAAAALGFSVLSREGFEADDILGTYARLASEAGDVETYIVTGDRDSLQLIGDTTAVLLETNKGTVEFDRAHFKEEYGIEPECFVDVKALMGDSSDNIPGVAGIGEKTALKLIAEYTSIDNLYGSLGTAELTPSLRAKLENGKESAELSRTLATICREVPDMPAIDGLGTGEIDQKAARELFTRLEFSGFIKRFGLENPTSDASDAPDYEFEHFDADGILSLGKNIALDLADGKFTVYDGERLGYFDGEPGELSDAFAGKNVICHDCKRIYKALDETGVRWRGCGFDVMLGAYVVNAGDSSFDIPRLAMEYLGEVANEKTPYVIYTFRLFDVLRGAVEDSGQGKLLSDIEMPLSSVLADMEETGFRIDKAGIEKYGEEISATAAELEERIYYLAGGEFNINSPKQLGEVLFERLGLPGAQKTKTGYSTNVDVLNKLRPLSPIVDDILDYRQVTKLKSTYVDGLLKVADENARVHTNFKQTGTATGRLSSTEPNLQNIPVRTELGRELRRYFISQNENYVLIDADYSQIELRLLAAISGDENMTSAFLSGEDIHTSTAAAVFNIPASEVTGELRKRAKAVNFGIMYGIGEYSLSQDLGISVAQAKRYISSYLASYPAIDAYLKNTIKKAYENGYVTTLFGRRRYITELSSKKHQLRAFGERVAMNSPIQGTAADIIKLAMLNVSRRLAESGIDAALILQVHDELIIEAHRDCADEALRILKEEMEGAVQLTVPLDVEVNIGENWFECK